MSNYLQSAMQAVPLVRKLSSSLRKRGDSLQHQPSFQEMQSRQSILRQGSCEYMNDAPLLVHWCLTSQCNYRCSYCFDAQRGYESNSCSLGQAEQAIRYIASSNRPSYQITLWGGEPTMFPYLSEVVDLFDSYLGDRIEVLRILTNGSLLQGHLDMLVKAARKTHVVVTISVHFEFANVDKLLELVKQYSDILDIELLIMLYPDCFDSIAETVERLIVMREEHPFDMSIDLLREPPSFTDLYRTYTSTHLEWAEATRARFADVATVSQKRSYEKHRETGWSFFLDRNGNNGIERVEGLDILALDSETGCDFSGLYCCMGTGSLEIDPWGRAKGAACRLAPVTCNIFEDNPFERDDWMSAVPCTREKCGCNLDYRIPKFLSREEARQFVSLCSRNQKQRIARSLDH